MPHLKRSASTKHLLKTSTKHLTKACPTTDCTTCTTGGTLAIVDYADGDLDAASPCTDCSSNVGGLTAWDGTFTYHSNPGFGLCIHYADRDATPLKIDGRVLSFNTRIEKTDVEPCAWRMTINCSTTDDGIPGSERTIWQGDLVATTAAEKLGAGTYTRSSGCDATSTLEVERL